jgi:hypothetical protein
VKREDGVEMPNESLENVEMAVSAWLKDNGIGFELKLASLIKSKFKGSAFSLNLTHSRQYTDLDEFTGVPKLRETDLVAQISKRISDGFYIHTWLIIECKVSHNPFVLYKNSERTTYPNFQPLDEIWNIKQSNNLLLENIHGVTSHDFLNRRDGLWCYGITSKVTLKDADDLKKNLALNGFWQVHSATKGVMKQSVLTDSIPRELHIFVPVLATAGPMVNLLLQENGEITQTRTNRELLVSQPHPDSGKALATWVVDQTGFETLVNDWMTFTEELDYRDF